MVRFLVGSFLTCVLVSFGGCGGHISPSTEAGQSGTAGTDNTTATPTPAPPTTTTNVPETVDEACQAVCDRLAQVSCMRANCVSDCQMALILPSCASTYVTFLTCELRVPFTCDNGVADLNGACTFQKNDFLICRTNPPAMMPTPDSMAPPSMSMDDGGDGPRGDSGLDDASLDARDGSDAGDASTDVSDASTGVNDAGSDAGDASPDAGDTSPDASDASLDCCF
jgi:hypothetical protein